MKTIKFTILITLILTFVSTSFSEYLTPELLRCPQWKSSWCWAGAAQACLTYYGIDHDSLSNEDCAHVITTGNDPQPMRVITTIINEFLPGYASSPANNLNSEEDFKAEADSGAPFACFWPGHFVTYAGYEGDKHLIMNPAPWGTDSNTAGRWEENLSYSYIADKTSSYVRTKGMPREPFIAVNTPGDGEEVEQHSVVNIRWGDNIDGEVKIELLKSDVLLEVLAASTPSNGSLEWEVTEDYEVGDDYKIQITSIDSAALTNKNKEPFSIIEEYIIADFPHVQTFDDMDTSGTRPLSEKWKQLDEDDFNWIVQHGPTPSNQYESTGPSADHTSGNGNYVYVEASSPNNPEKKTLMISPKFNLKGVTDPELIFWCHMWSDSNTMGNLYVDIEVDGVLKEGVIHLKDDHGKEWFEVKQELSQYVGERVRFIFRGITGSSWCGDMAVDDFKIDGATPITVTPKVPMTYGFALHGSRIFYRIPENSSRKPLTIKLYNTKGTCVRTLVNGPAKAGYNSVSLEQTNRGTELASGTYLCQLKTSEFTKTITVLLKK